MEKAKKATLGEDLIEAMGEAVAHARGEIALPTWVINTEADVDVKAIRAKFHLTRKDFAARFGLDPRTLQEWEQRRRRPDRATRVLLRVIEKEPAAVDRALQE
jgi:putative transcriptional regulator